jgi:hypothetical protein
LFFTNNLPTWFDLDQSAKTESLYHILKPQFSACRNCRHQALMRHICALSPPALKSRAQFEMTALFPNFSRFAQTSRSLPELHACPNFMGPLPCFRRTGSESPVQIYPQGFSF